MTFLLWKLEVSKNECDNISFVGARWKLVDNYDGFTEYHNKFPMLDPTSFQDSW